MGPAGAWRQAVKAEAKGAGPALAGAGGRWTVTGGRWAMGGGQWNWEVGGRNCGDGHGTVLRSPRPVSYTAVTPVVPVWMGGKTGGFRGGYLQGSVALGQALLTRRSQARLLSIYCLYFV